MTRLTVEVKQDHLERLIRRPLGGLNELLWNAIDADAHTVDADVILNDLDGLEAVEVRDDGTGITRQTADDHFSHLGGSWKKHAVTTAGGRQLHGQAGQGRWASYGLGEMVTWTSTTMGPTGSFSRIRIQGRRQSLNVFDVDGPEPCDGPTGTVVRIDQLNEAARKALAQDDVVSQLTTTFALALEQYPLTITWRGQRLDPASIQSRRHEKALHVDPVGVLDRRGQACTRNRSPPQAGRSRTRRLRHPRRAAGDGASGHLGADHRRRPTPPQLRP